MKVLYLGLSNHIRGIAEALSDKSDKLHFVKPGELTSRGFIIKQILDLEPVDVIVAAEAIRDQIPQSPTLIKTLRDEGRVQPVIGITNNYTEKTIVDLFKAGANAVIPFRVSKDGTFSSGSEMLWSQVERLNELAKTPVSAELPKIAAGNAASNAGAKAGISFGGFASDGAGNFRLHGKELVLTTLSAKVLDVFVRHRERTITPQTIIENAYDKNGSISFETVKKAVFFLHHRIRKNLTDTGIPFKFPIIEWDGKEGWRFSLSNLRRLKDVMAPEPMDAVVPQTVSTAGLHAYRGDKTMTTKYGFSIGKNVSQIFYGGRELAMPEGQIKIFAKLLEADGAPVSRHQMRETCFPRAYQINDNALGQYVGRVGACLTTELDRLGLPVGYSLIENIRSRGWNLHTNNLRRLYVAASEKGLISAPEKTFAHELVSSMTDLRAYHDFTVDPAKPGVYFRGNALRFSKTSAKVVSVLLGAEGDTVSRAKIREACYPKGTNVSENSISVAVNRASRQLTDELKRLGNSFDFPLIENSKIDGWYVSQETLIRFEAMRPILTYVSVPKVPLLRLLPS